MPSFKVKIGTNNEDVKDCIGEKFNALAKMLGSEVNQYVKKELNNIMEIISKNEVIDKSIEDRINHKLEELEKEVDKLIKSKIEQYPSNPNGIIDKSKKLVMNEICNSINIEKLKAAFREGLKIKDDQDL